MELYEAGVRVLITGPPLWQVLIMAVLVGITVGGITLAAYAALLRIHIHRERRGWWKSYCEEWGLDEGTGEKR